MAKELRKKDALEYHEKGRPGKIEVVPTKATKTQRDLSLAYSPGVAEPCKEIAANKAVKLSMLQHLLNIPCLLYSIIYFPNIV